MKSIKEETDKNITLETFHKKNEPTPNIFTEVFNRMDLDKDFKEIRQNYSSWDVVFTSKHLKDAEIFLENLSSGEKQIIFKGVYFLREFAKHQDPNNKTNPTIACLIDEPEISMHPRWQKKILNFYKGLVSNADKKQTSQIFMATHSPFIIHEANLKTDKVIVLKKDDTGKIIVDKNPLFERCDGEMFIEAAFNIDNFRKTNKPLVITEGKTDKKIIETAWEKLYLNKEMPFEIHDAGIYPDKVNTDDGDQKREGGANHITSLLSYSLRFNENHIIGLFDNDYEGNREMVNLKKNKFNLTKISNFSYCKYPDKDVFGLLLPCPDHRKNYVCEGAKAKKKLVIEHYFNDMILEKYKLKGEAYDESIFYINDGSKTKFATETIQTLPPEDFASFKILFDALKHLLELSSEQ
ncbi:MAG: AAA family ATPase [Cyanobacteria bacterium REEB446]|nr:AAA family ATPase [Cyanobacteria bacterium REEB446]